MIINEKDCISTWKKCLKYITENGVDFVDSDKRKCREVLNMTANIEHPEYDYDKLIDQMKKFDWIYPSAEELSNIIFNREDSAMYEYSYGPRIFNFLGKKDQVNDYIIPLLKSNHNSRRAVISLFNPSTDSDITSSNIPSLMFIQFRIHDNKLRCTCFIRSNDFFIGWPGNIYQIYLLQKYIADKLGIKTGMLTTISSSAHIFHEHQGSISNIL